MSDGITQRMASLCISHRLDGQFSLPVFFHAIFPTHFLSVANSLQA